MEGAFEAVKELSKRYILCAASNGPYEQQIDRLNKAGIAVCFTGIYISERIGASKPSAEFFSECVRLLENDLSGNARICRDEIMMIGDSISADMEGAINYGLKTCYYDRKKKGTGNLKTDLVIQSMAELLHVL